MKLIAVLLFVTVTNALCKTVTDRTSTNEIDEENELRDIEFWERDLQKSFSSKLRSISKSPTAPTSQLSPAPSFTPVRWEKIGDDIEGETVRQYVGEHVAISGDGKWVVAIGGGNVRMFESPTDVGTWSLLSDFSHAIDTDMESLELTSDGSSLVIGCPSYRDDGDMLARQHRGSALVLRYSYNKNGDSSWIQVGSTLYGDGDADQFGMSVAITDDGNTIAVGAWMSDYVRVFDLVANITWDVSNTVQGRIGTHYGVSVSMTADGTRMAIGASYENYNGEASGSVFLYDLTSSLITLIQRIDGAETYTEFGCPIALSKNGLYLAVTASRKDYVQIFYDFTGYSFVQVGLDIHGPDRSFFGYSISISADGQRLAIGSPYNSEGERWSGKTMLYSLDQKGWGLIGELEGSTQQEYSGSSVAISGDGTRVTVGSRYTGIDGFDSGHAHVYESKIIGGEEALYR